MPHSEILRWALCEYGVSSHLHWEWHLLLWISCLKLQVKYSQRLSVKESLPQLPLPKSTKICHSSNLPQSAIPKICQICHWRNLSQRLLIQGWQISATNCHSTNLLRSVTLGICHSLSIQISAKSAIGEICLLWQNWQFLEIRRDLSLQKSAKSVTPSICHICHWKNLPHQGFNGNFDRLFKW